MDYSEWMPMFTHIVMHYTVLTAIIIPWILQYVPMLCSKVTKFFSRKEFSNRSTATTCSAGKTYQDKVTTKLIYLFYDRHTSISIY